MKKTTLILSIAILLVMSFGGAVFAYTADDVLAKLADSNVPEEYISQAEAYFDENPMTEAQADTIMQHIEAALVIADGETKASDLTSEQRGDIFQELVQAGQALDLVVTYEGATDYEKGTVYVRDTDDNVVFMVSAEDAVKQTGFDYTIVLVGLALLAAASASGILIHKKTRAAEKA